MAAASEAGTMGRYGDRAIPVDPISDTSRTSTRSTQMAPAPWLKLPWLATDDESGIEPEGVYSQGDRPDPLKAGWQRAVDGFVGGIRQLAPPHAILTEESECCEERMTDYSRPRQYSKSRPYRV